MLRNIDKENYIYFGQYKTPLIYNWLLQRWADNETGQKYGLPKLDGRLLLLDGHLFIYKKDWETIENWTQEIVNKKSEKSFRSVFKLMDGKINRMLVSAKNLKECKDLKASCFDEFFKAMNQMEYPWHLVLPMGARIEKIIREKLAGYDLPDEYLQLFLTPSKTVFIVKQKKEVIVIKKELIRNDILDKIKKLSTKQSFEFLKINYPKICKKINKHIAKYRWFGMMHMWGAPFSKEKFLEQLESLSISKDAIKRAAVKLPKDLSWLQKQTQELSYWRNHVAEICGVASYMALNKFKYGSEKMGLDYDLAGWLSPQEFLSGLQDKNIPSRLILEKRKKAFGLIIKKGKITIVTGKELKKDIKFILGSVSEESQIIGTIANPGKARGIAKIVLSPHELNKVNKGDILISSETTPDFMPAVYKAVALVTDIGGITSHAAIVSREIGLPCIVGTKIATRIFKDGDFIEVDANKGIVLKIKS